MALRYFRGRVDLHKLSLSDLAAVAGALATLERLASDGAITFESGASRDVGPRPDMKGSRSVGRPQLQLDIIEVLRDGGSMNYPAIQAATGMKEGSLSPTLGTLTREGVIRKETKARPPGQRGRARREDTVFSLSPDFAD